MVFISLAHYYGKKPCQLCVMPAGQLAISLVHLSSSQNNDCGAVNSFFDHSKFEAMKLQSGCEAARSDEHQFCAKIKVSK